MGRKAHPLPPIHAADSHPVITAHGATATIEAAATSEDGKPVGPPSYWPILTTVGRSE